MPTGYTAAVSDGEITELAPFVMRLARGMGALIMMRDDDWDAPIPEAFKPSTYNADKLSDARAERDRLRAMTMAECTAAAQAEAITFDLELDAAKNAHREKRERYADMIDKVEAWEDAPEGIKEFGLQQLRESMEFDCREPFTYWRERPSEDGATWKAERLAKVERDIMYHAKSQAEEEARTEGRNAWLAQLRQSLSTNPPHKDNEG